jgi:DNA-binding transcriptional LysR family regulator
MGNLPFTLRQLEVFEQLCELRSFRLASEALGISQASVSNQLKALEEQLGMRLIVREPGKRPHLTSEGSAFLADLGKFWQSAYSLAAHRKSNPQAGTEVRRLRVLASHYLLKDYVRPKLFKFFESHPLIQLDFFSPDINEGPRRVFARDSFDLGLFHENCKSPLTPGFRELARLRCGVFGNRKFAGKGNGHLSVERLSELPFLLPIGGSYYENETLEMLSSHGIRLTKVVGRTQYLDVMSSMYDRGTCVGVTIEPLLSADQRRNTVLLYPLDDWRLSFYRNPRLDDPQADAAEKFLISSVLDDPAYPVLGSLDGDTGD